MIIACLSGEGCGKTKNWDPSRGWAVNWCFLWDNFTLCHTLPGNSLFIIWCWTDLVETSICAQTRPGDLVVPDLNGNPPIPLSIASIFLFFSSHFKSSLAKSSIFYFIFYLRRFELLLAKYRLLFASIHQAFFINHSPFHPFTSITIHAHVFLAYYILFSQISKS